ncbi:hypothetical protein CMQ_1048 [Grosmannia clavigera kw1407]|uniref:Uncharacterized protein n=1 Tax=Grosmannia clavigera (strain kw1407 / UAMH 11150) TaxID=655863 RepID=F0XDR0_GROCL|nr:uncharacterized protein CMQ_1048 [Grosmannia clavigera kw1407]EFX04120.1 hypothetical protein CMQ_1048 [Grosmannia clavigera kw1407]
MDTDILNASHNDDRDAELDAWLAGKTPFQQDDGISYSEHSQFATNCMGESIPPYNFDLFSERAHSQVTNRWNPDYNYDSDSGSYEAEQENSITPKGKAVYQNSVDENVNVYRGTYTPTKYIETAGEKENTSFAGGRQRKARISSRKSAAANSKWIEERKTADYASHNRRSRSKLSSRNQNAGWKAHPSFEIEECLDDGDSRTMRHIVDCEVISNPDSISECGRSDWSNRAGIGHLRSPQ